MEVYVRRQCPGAAFRTLRERQLSPRRGGRACPALLISLALLVAPAEALGATEGDFDGDGFDDLAIGVPNEPVGGDEAAGAVHVLYGSSSGLESETSDFWTQENDGVGSSAEPDDRFGYALAAGDFDRDGKDDLAVAAPFEDAGAANTGATSVLYGSASGLTNFESDLLVEGAGGLTGQAEEGDYFGHTLATGDLGDGPEEELVIGHPFDDVLGVENAGAVTVVHGSGSGLTTAGSEFWSQDSKGVSGDGSQDGDTYGFSLAIADFGGAGRDDLAVGITSEGEAVGAVHVLYGDTAGLTDAADQIWDQGQGVQGSPEEFDIFSWSLAAHDLNGDDHAELVVGAPGETLGSSDEQIFNAGAVNVLFGSESGLTAAGDELWTQRPNGVPGKPTQDEFFGYALAAANFGKGGEHDLAIGVPEDFAGVNNSGAVNVLYGTAGGLTTTGAQLWGQASKGIKGEAGNFDLFGAALGAGSFGLGGQADLAAGAPCDDIVPGDFDSTRGGSVGVLYGGPDGLGPANDQLWHEGSPGVSSQPDGDESFGSSLAPGGTGGSRAPLGVVCESFP